MGSGFLNVRFSAAAKDIFVPWLNFCFAIMCLTSGWHSENFRGKMCNGQSINCLLGKFSPSRMIKSSSEKAWEDISELFINYHCYLFPEIGMENSVPELV